MAVWEGFTRFFRDECGALGSRLHHGADGAFYAYAQWPSAAVMNAAADVEPTREFTQLRIYWAELCAPSEVLWEGDVVADLLA